MWEIDTLLKNSIAVIKKSEISANQKKQIIWNLENIPELYEFDAGVEKTELDKGFDYTPMNPYEIGVIVATESQNQSINHIIYDWSSFLLNFWQEYFSDNYNANELKQTHLLKLKSIYSNYNFDDYQPTHATLTMYNEGKNWFSTSQNELIKWFCTK